MAHLQLAAVLQFYNAQAKRLAVLWTIERTDGLDPLYLTNHDVPIPFEGQIHTPAAAPDASARRAVDALKDANLEFRGAVSSSAITSEDLRAGHYRDAKITEIIVDWRYPFNGALARNVFWVQQAHFDAEVWTSELLGPQRWTKRKMGEILTRTCDRDLYDDLCTVSKAGFTESDVVVLGTEDGDKRMVIFANPATMGSFQDGSFDYGEIEMVLGANAGKKENVKVYRAVDRRIELQGPMPFEISPGDTFHISQGCDKLSTTCRTKFSNLINYGGFIFLPGTDKVITVPSTRG